jgi:hypothetical protein
VESGVSGLARPREWDLVVTTTCAATGDRCVFVCRAEGRVRVDEGDQAAAACAAEALEGELDPPYRALALRREGDTWAVGAVAIEVAELPDDVRGEELMLTVTQEGGRELLVDGEPAEAGLDALTALAGDRYDAYVLRAARLEGALWEVTIDPL